MKNPAHILFVFALLLDFQFASRSAAESASPEDYKKYALSHEGDVRRGKQLFNDEQKLGCAKCHSVDGHANKAGPDLSAAGDAFGRSDLIDSILQPSAKIAVGYGTVIVETKTGGEFQGVLKQTTGAGLQLMGADGKLIFIGTPDIKEKRASSFR